MARQAVRGRQGRHEFHQCVEETPANGALVCSLAPGGSDVDMQTQLRSANGAPGPADVSGLSKGLLSLAGRSA
jgi:hypothetical protein